MFGGTAQHPRCEQEQHRPADQGDRDSDRHELNIVSSTPAGSAMPAMSRLELVPIRVAEPASVVACATGSSTPRAGTPDWRSSSLAAGKSIATIGVVLISADAMPTGGTSRARVWVAVVTPLSKR